MESKRTDRVEWTAAGNDHFTGVVWIGKLTSPGSPGVRATVVRFEPGARSDWHSHPEGQVLHCLSGAGRAGTADGRTLDITPGDLLHADPGEVHWHGANPDSQMIHISHTCGESALWPGRKVTEEEYLRGR